MAKKTKQTDLVTVIIQKGKRRIITKAPLSGIDRIVCVINRQFTNAPNTTQISSGAGRSSAAGNNAAISSPYTQQQQSVGAGGKAINTDAKGTPKNNKKWAPTKKSGRLKSVYTPHAPVMTHYNHKEVVIVINDQIVKLSKRDGNAAATQVASGAGTYSTGGTNAAIESKGTKQQHAVGGGGTAKNSFTQKQQARKKSRGRHRPKLG